MSFDVVFPKGNEEQLLAMAKQLSIKKLLFCYTLKDPLLKERAKEIEKLSDKYITALFGILVMTQQDVIKAKSITPHLLAPARPEFFEDKRVAYIINMEGSNRDDFIHHRNSGLNQVFLEQAARTSKILLVNIRQLLSGKIPPAVVLGRMQQNNMMYGKHDVAVIAISGAQQALEMRAPKDLQHFLQL